MSVFFFNDTATTEIYTYCHTLSLHDALPISLDPIYFSFEGSEALFLKHLRQKQAGVAVDQGVEIRSEEHTSELQSLMRISYAVFCLTKKTAEMHTKRPSLLHNHLRHPLPHPKRASHYLLATTPTHSKP